MKSFDFENLLFDLANNHQGFNHAKKIINKIVNI